MDPTWGRLGRFQVRPPGRRLLSRTLLLATAFALAIASPPGAAAERPPLPVVASVDLDRYAGTWHEIARYPNRFERTCARDVTANYTRHPDGTIAVVNACRREDGTVQRAEGRARVVAPAKLEVTFVPAWLDFLPFVWGDYWVIELAPDYSYVVVGEPSREYLWILAREPRLAEPTLKAITSRLPELGFDPAKLVWNPAP